MKMWQRGEQVQAYTLVETLVLLNISLTELVQEMEYQNVVAIMQDGKLYISALDILWIKQNRTEKEHGDESL